jgi:hypothetical protein
MSVFSVIGAEGFQFCHPEDEADFDTIDALVNGTPRAKTWRPIRMRLINEDGAQRLTESDSPWLGSWALIFRRRAVDALGSLLIDFGELLPIDCPEAELYFYNPTVFLDALDFGRSDVIEVDSGVVQSIIRPVFLSNAIGDQQFFKLMGVASSGTYAGDRVVNRWEEAKLRGLKFTRQELY